MTARKGLVLDANILLRAVFGQRVRQILEAYEDQANFYAPDVCFQDARKYIPDLSTRRRFDVDLALSVLEQISLIVEPVDRSLYEDYQETASARVLPRDPDDWPVAAVALLLDLPIWTEDQDFFGSGIATWTTDRVELFLREL
jgi:predicted nucleic acid-binding protein